MIEDGRRGRTQTCDDDDDDDDDDGDVVVVVVVAVVVVDDDYDDDASDGGADGDDDCDDCDVTCYLFNIVCVHVHVVHYMWGVCMYWYMCDCMLMPACMYV